MKADEIVKRINKAKTEIEYAKRKRKELDGKCEAIRKELKRLGLR